MFVLCGTMLAVAVYGVADYHSRQNVVTVGFWVDESVTFDLPIEIRNAIARIEILGEGSAGAVTLLDDQNRRRRVGLVFGGTADQAQPLLAPTYYIARALAPYSEIREGRGGVAERPAAMREQERVR